MGFNFRIYPILASKNPLGFSRLNPNGFLGVKTNFQGLYDFYVLHLFINFESFDVLSYFLNHLVVIFIPNP